MDIFASFKGWGRFLPRRPKTPMPPPLNDDDIRAHIAQALEDELPITRAPNRGGSELLVIEPVPGWRIVIGTSVRGKTSVLSSVPQPVHHTPAGTLL